MYNIYLIQPPFLGDNQSKKEWTYHEICSEDNFIVLLKSWGTDFETKIIEKIMN